MCTLSLRSQRARLAVCTFVVGPLATAGPALAAAHARCVIDIGAADPLVERLRLHPGTYRCQAKLAPPALGLDPVAAALVDRDGDGNRELVIAYRGAGAGALVWRALLDGAPQRAEAPQTLDFAPVEMVAGDLDGDGRDELLLANADRSELVSVRVGTQGTPESAVRVAAPGVPRRLALVDLSPHDGLPELVFATGEPERIQDWRAGGPHGVLSELGAGRWSRLAADPTKASATALPQLLLAGRLDRDAHPELLIALADGSVGVAELILAVIEVDSTSEAVDFGGAQQVGDLPGGDGLITLREAIIAANNTAGADVIEFNIPFAGNDCHDGACWFTPSDGEAGPLPQILGSGGAVTFDGYTQTQNRGDTNADGPELVLDGSGLSGARGLDFQGAANSAVIDFVIASFDDGIWAFDADGLLVQGCYLGTTPDGEASQPNGTGIQLLGGTGNALVGGPGAHGVSPMVANRNLISGNLGSGVMLAGAGTTDNDIQANRIGTNRQGTAALANAIGIAVGSGAGGNRIGSTAAGTGNLVSGNDPFGIELAGVGSTLVQGNTVGADASGLVALANAFGIRLQQAAQGNTIGGTTAAARNLISGNTNHGISIADPGTDDNLIYGNWIGLDATGAAALGNQYGIYATASMGTEVGSGIAGAGNVVAGNECGVCLDGTGGFLVRGNRFGTDATGTTAIPAPGFTVHLSIASSDGTEVGGAGAGEGNLFAGTVDRGLEVVGPDAAGNRIRGNTFGINAAGSGVVGSLSTAIQVVGGATVTEIGGPTLAERNWIAGAGLGLRISGAGTAGTLVRGNVFGRAPSGSGGAFSNTAGIGIGGGATGSVIGGLAGAANEIANSQQVGVRILDDTTLGHRISRNSMFANAELGIDLGIDGVTANDPGDGDVGPNALVNWPVLTSAVNTCGGSVTAVSGSIDSSNPDLGLVEMFSSTNPHPAGNGEGETFVGQATPTPGGAILVGTALVPVGRFVTATYRDAADNTSELSNQVLVVTTPLAPAALDAEPAGGGTQIALDWVDAASDETGFRIERRAAGGSFGLLANVGANVTAFTDPGPLVPGGTYSYRVRAESTAGAGCQSGWSNVASAMVPPTTTAFCRQRASHHVAAGNPYAEAVGPGLFGITWRETNDDRATLYYARLDATGAMLGAPVAVREAATQAIGSMIVWSGDRWGMVWYERLHDRWGLFFQTFDILGSLLTGPVPVTEPAGYPIVQLLEPGFGWDGEGWGIAWPDIRNGFTEVRYAHIAADGVTKETADLLVNDNGGSGLAPRLAWNGTHYVIAWFDSRTASLQIYTRRLDRNGTPAGASVAATTAAVLGITTLVDLRWNGMSGGGGELGLAWMDGRDGNFGAYFRRLDLAGLPLSPETRVADPVAPDDVDQAQLALRRLATRWVVAAEDFRGPAFNEEIRLSFADPAGAKLGADVLVSTPNADDNADDPAIAWDGTQLLVAWHQSVAPDSLEVIAQVADETGDPGANPRRNLTGGHAPGIGPGLAALELLPTGFAALWDDGRSNVGGDVFLRRIDGDGLSIGAEIPVADTAAASSQGHLSAEWSGEVLAVVWQSALASGAMVLSRFDGSGVKLGPDVALPMNATSNGGSDVHWTGEHFLVAFEKAGAPDHQELHVAAYLPDGTLLSGPHRISSAGGRSMHPSLAGTGSPVVVWRDTRDGNGEIYAAALDRFGVRVGPENRLTNQAADSARPALAWNGEQYGLAWEDARSGQLEIWFQRLGSDATPLGAEIQLSADFGRRPGIGTDGSGWGIAYGGFAVGAPALGGLWLARVDASGVEIGTERLALQSANLAAANAVVWDGARYVVAAVDRSYFAGELSLKSSACAFDATPPACPTGAIATAAGRDVTLAWTPAVDADFAVEMQVLERDDAEIAILAPAAATYLDRALAPGSYTYRLGAVNGGYLAAASCPTSEVVVPIFVDGFENGDTSGWSANVP